jgi:hypothetical protein
MRRKQDPDIAYRERFARQDADDANDRPCRHYRNRSSVCKYPLQQQRYTDAFGWSRSAAKDSVMLMPANAFINFLIIN